MCWCVDEGGCWKLIDDAKSPTGYRYVIEAAGLDGNLYQIEPYDVVMEEFEHLPIEITRMIANAEAVLRVTVTPREG